MFLGEKETKQLNIPTTAVSRRVRETRARLERLQQGTRGWGSKSAGPKHQMRLEKLNIRSNEKNLMLQYSDLQGVQIRADISGTNMSDWLKNVISL